MLLPTLLFCLVLTIVFVILLKGNNSEERIEELLNQTK